MRELPERYSQTGNTKAGGMGMVYICEDNHLNRYVAIKFIQDHVDRRRMMDEINALIKMRSKHVVQIYDVIVSTSSIGIVQEYISGNDLEPKKDWIDEEFLKTIWQIASGISDIHDTGVIHRDIKPNNMKLDSEGILKIFDFGLARDQGIGAQTRGFVGTQGYAAPEQYTGISSFTTAIDTYAFGISVLYLTLGNIPKELLETPPNIGAHSYFERIPVKLHRNLIDILDQCLAAIPHKRPTMKQVRDAIAKYLLIDKHQALFLYDGNPKFLNKENRHVSLELPNIGSLDIRYDGLTFSAQNVKGEVAINNCNAKDGDEIPGSCVVALGNKDRKMNQRAFITFDISNPEIVL